MDEIICSGTTADIVPLIKALSLEGALFLAEEFPRSLINDPVKRKQLLLFNFLDRVSDDERRRFTSGHVFSRKAELRWEKTFDGSYSIVYLGPSTALDGLKESRQESISSGQYGQYDTETRCYYLFGQRLSEDTRQQMKIQVDASLSADRLYAEARIPRLLHYPWTEPPGNKEEKRVQLEVLEYREKDTGQIRYYRFFGVKLAE